MAVEFPLFKTRLSPPQLKQAILRRPTLSKKLKKMSDFPVTVIQSGPGYGKSTALASYFVDKGGFSWYSISEQDEELLLFLNYFIQSIRIEFPDFGTHLLQQLKGIKTKEALSYLCSEFVNACEQVEQPFFVVLDDFHLIEQSQVIMSWMELLIENLPTQIHLVISSRTWPDLPVLATYKAKNQLLHINEHDFTLSQEEIDVLFSDVYQLELGFEQVQEIYQLTEGWVMAVQLIGHQATEDGKLPPIYKNRPDASLKDLFQFLALDVLSKQSVEIRALLHQTCIFEEISLTVLSEIFHLENPLAVIQKLVKANLFITSIGEETFRYHALFRDFLVSDLKANHPGLHKHLHEMAGAYFEKEGLYDKALGHYESIQQVEAVTRILVHYGHIMIGLGLLDRLKEKLLGISQEDKDHYPLLWVYEGDIDRYRCHYERSLDSYNRALKLSKKGEQWSVMSSAYEGIAQVYLDTIQPVRADSYLKESVQVIPVGKDQERRHRLLRLMAENLVNLGRAKEAEKRLTEQMGQPLRNVNNEKLEPRLLIRMGRLDEAINLLLAQKQTEQNEKNHLQQSHRETDLLLSLIYSFQGLPLRAKELAQEGVMRGISYKAPFVEACGWMRMGHAVQLASYYDLTHAITCYETSLRLMDHIQMPRGKAEPLMGLCGVYGQLGDFEKAIHYGEQALYETERVHDEWLSSLIRLSLVKQAYYAKEDWQAISLLEQCHSAFDRCGDAYGMTLTFLWQALWAYEKEEEETFIKSMTAFIDWVKAYKYEFLLDKRTLLGPNDPQIISQLLGEAAKRSKDHRRIEAFMLARHLTPLPNHPGYTLRVQTFGQFRVWLGNREIHADDWQRSKAKELFQFLVTSRKRWVTKEEMMALLWEDQTETAASSGFKVAFSTLNKVLEPDRKKRDASFFIERNGPLYRLNATGIYIDIDEFESTVQNGLDAGDERTKQQWLEEGILIYKGDFLPDNRFDDWCLDERERTQLLFLRSLEQLAQISIKLENYEQTIGYCEQILKVDDCWEEAYRLIMQCYYAKNNRPQAIKYYQRCLDHLGRELGIPPMKATIDLYEKVLEGS